MKNVSNLEVEKDNRKLHNVHQGTKTNNVNNKINDEIKDLYDKNRLLQLQSLAAFISASIGKITT